MIAIATRHWALLCMAACCTSMLANVVTLSHAELKQNLCKAISVRATLARSTSGNCNDIRAEVGDALWVVLYLSEWLALTHWERLW